MGVGATARLRTASVGPPLALMAGAVQPAVGPRSHMLAATGPSPQASILAAWGAAVHPGRPSRRLPAGQDGRSAAARSAQPARGGPNRASRPSARRPAALGALSAREWNSRAARAQNKPQLNNLALSCMITLGFRGIHAAKTTPLPPVENLWITPGNPPSPENFSTRFPQVFHKFSTSFPQP